MMRRSNQKNKLLRSVFLFSALLVFITGNVTLLAQTTEKLSYTFHFEKPLINEVYVGSSSFVETTRRELIPAPTIIV